jgi:hypothetical protein
MGEIDVVGLPGIHFPGHFPVFFHIVAYKPGLRFAAPLGGFMAFSASVYPGDPAIGAIGAQAVTGLAILALVRDMAEIYRLSLLRIEQTRKNEPSDGQGADKAQ